MWKPKVSLKTDWNIQATLGQSFSKTKKFHSSNWERADDGRSHATQLIQRKHRPIVKAQLSGPHLLFTLKIRHSSSIRRHALCYTWQRVGSHQRTVGTNYRVQTGKSRLYQMTTLRETSQRQHSKLCVQPSPLRIHGNTWVFTALLVPPGASVDQSSPTASCSVQHNGCLLQLPNNWSHLGASC